MAGGYHVRVQICQRCGTRCDLVAPYMPCGRVDFSKVATASDLDTLRCYRCQFLDKPEWKARQLRKLFRNWWRLAVGMNRPFPPGLEERPGD